MIEVQTNKSSPDPFTDLYRSTDPLNTSLNICHIPKDIGNFFSDDVNRDDVYIIS